MNRRFVSHMRAMAAGASIALGAAPPALAFGYTAPGLIGSVTGTGSYLRFSMPTVTDNPDNCAATSFFILKTDHLNYQALASILITAQVTQREVSFRVEGCWANYPLIDVVYMNEP